MLQARPCESPLKLASPDGVAPSTTTIWLMPCVAAMPLALPTTATLDGWDWRSFDLERDSARANAVDKDIDELDPHLAAFAKHGGKLLIYHGCADQQVAPGSSIEFYESVLKLSAQLAQGPNWIRLFVVCGGL